MTSPQNELLVRIAEQEARLAALDADRENARAVLEHLREQLTAESSADQPAPGLSVDAAVGAHPTPADKVQLFRSLFRGREEVFPTRFVSKRTGKPGYAPACANKFLQGVCGLPTVRCGECPNQAFVPVDDRAVLAHLQGRHVMGVYPLLTDETCWFLAADFDGAEWNQDVAAFAETCRSVEIPVSLERSRSGNGAHAWFFFAQPVAASTARKMGSFLITETMARRHQLAMSSYDRLFPNQDTMPRGGFGNLIALPLQHEARRAGNSVFLDNTFEPYPDQWAYLASVERMHRAAVESVADDATRRGAIIGVREVEAQEDEDRTPWKRRPSRRSQRMPIPGPFPARVHAVLAQRLFLEKAGLPSPLLNEAKRIAAFQNPEFYKRQRLRLSITTTPRVICCAEELPHHVALPRGCQDELERLLRAQGIDIDVVDERQPGQPARFTFVGDLTPLQQLASRALLQHDIGVLVAPPGVGKTVLGTYLVAVRGRNTLVLVHRRPLLDQWVTQLAMFLGLGENEVGQIGGGKRKPNGTLDVAMIQSLVRKGSVDELVGTYEQVIVDECHHTPAVSFERVLSEVKARYVVGLTATPRRRDGHDPILEMQLGPVRYLVDPRSAGARGPFEHQLIVRETGFECPGAAAEAGIQGLYGDLARDQRRNDMILDDVIRAIDEHRSPILLTERRDHLEYFAERLHGFVRHLVVLRGGMTARERAAVKAQLASIPDNEERLVLATGRYVGEGFDDARLDTLFLALPISWKGTLAQYTGRLHRLHSGKTEVRIFDYVDREVPMLMAMFEKRLREYRALGYVRRESLPVRSRAAVERTIVYDDEIGRSRDSP